MPGKQKKRKRRLRVGNLLVLIFLFVMVVAGAGYFYCRQAVSAIQKDSEVVTFTVGPGAGAKTVAQQLQSQGIIKNGFVAYYYMKMDHLTEVKTGDFELDKSWDVKKIFTVLNDSNAALSTDATVTIVEGDWAKHIAEKIASVTNVSADELLALWNDETYVRSLMSKYPFLTEEMFNDNVRVLLEGYLAPNTYRFYTKTTAKEITEKILDQSLTVYDQYAAQMAKSSLSIHQIYTLASIVQYESGNITDMKNIAGVFYNRLAINMPLQSSVTVCYAIDIDKDDDWMNCEMNSSYDSPYNTYKYQGLPPGAIENAGVDALDAVLNPTKNDYYYFMADVNGDGTVYYAKTLEEHNANVKKYLQ